MSRWVSFAPEIGKQHTTIVGQSEIKFAKGVDAATAEVLARIQQIADQSVTAAIQSYLPAVLINNKSLRNALQHATRAEFVYTTDTAHQGSDGEYAVPFTVYVTVI